VADAQVPRMRLVRGGQRPYYRGRVGVDERQRRNCVVRTPGPAAATGNIHVREVIAGKRRRSGGHAH
jgi:hypothetical protein